jgi:hypothetical protein
MNKCFSYNKCMCCERRSMCYTYQMFKYILSEGQTNYELQIANPSAYLNPKF